MKMVNSDDLRSENQTNPLDKTRRNFSPKRKLTLRSHDV